MQTTSSPQPRTTTTRTTTRTTNGRRGRSRQVVVPPPLGSLTQRDHRPGVACRGCGSLHVTRLTLALTDGTPVEFISCHRCEHRTWEHAGAELTVDGVIARTRKD